MIPSDETSESEVDFNELRPTWSPGFSRRRRQRSFGTQLEVLATIFVTSHAIAIAYLMVNSWPPSMNVLRDSPFDFLPLITGVFTVVLAPEFRSYLPFFLLAPAVYLLFFHWLQLYQRATSEIQPFGALGAIFQGTLLGTVLFGLMGLAYGNAQGEEGLRYPSLLFAYVGALVFLGVLLLHSGLLIMALMLRAAGIGRMHIAVIGNPGRARHLMEILQAPRSEYHFQGLIAPHKIPSHEDAGSAAYIGTVGQLEDLINDHYLEELVLAIDPAELTEEQRMNVAQTCWKLGVDLKMVTPFHPYFHTSGRPELLGDVPLLHVERVGLYGNWAQFLKRAMDIAMSASVLM